MVEAKFNSVPNLIDLRSKISSSIFGNIEIQEFGDPSTILFRIEKNSNNENEQKLIVSNLKKILYLKT